MVRTNFRRTLGIWIACIVGLLIVGYGCYEARHLIAGPEVSILTPKNGDTLTSDYIEITGTAENIAYISLNDRQIYIDDKGNFKESLLLSPGYNKEVIVAKDKFGRVKHETIELVYTPQNAGEHVTLVD
jgi:hypothetical protein